MSDIPPPEEPGWYADAEGAWWWWDGSSWTAAPRPTGADPAADAEAARDKERSQALIMWVVFLIGGGWIVALVFYVISDTKRFTKHHAAEALNLTIVTIVPNVIAAGVFGAGVVQWIASTDGDPDPQLELNGLMVAGIGLLALLSLLTTGLAIAAAVKTHKGAWWRLPIGFHPVRGALRKGEEPPYQVGG